MNLKLPAEPQTVLHMPRAFGDAMANMGQGRDNGEGELLCRVPPGLAPFEEKLRRDLTPSSKGRRRRSRCTAASDGPVVASVPADARAAADDAAASDGESLWSFSPSPKRRRRKPRQSIVAAAAADGDAMDDGPDDDERDLWLTGRLEDVMAHAVRLRVCSDCGSVPSGQACVFYIAPLHEVDTAVLAAAVAAPYLSPASPGFRAPEAHIDVAFLAEERLPSRESRARDVRLASALGGIGSRFVADCTAGAADCVAYTCEAGAASGVRVAAVMPKADGASDAHAASAGAAVSKLKQMTLMTLPTEAPGGRVVSLRGLPLLEDIYATGLRSVRMVAMVAQAWHSLKAPEAVRAVVDTLERETRAALQETDGERLCDVLFRSVGALAPPGSSLWPRKSHPSHVISDPECEAGSELEQLQAMQERRLRELVIVCLTNLDLEYAAVHARVLPALRHLELLLALQDGGAKAAHVGRIQWRRIASLTESALQGLPKEREKSRRLAGRLNALPPPGSFKRWLCVAVGCKGLAGWTQQPSSDGLGPTGPRCSMRWPRVLCVVDGCSSKSVGVVVTDDEYGPAGSRCVRHAGRRCALSGCVCFADGRVSVADAFGPLGKRCRRHLLDKTLGCSIPGCPRWPKRSQAVPDEFGPAGKRCLLHGAQRCTVSGCRKIRWGVVRESDEHGAPGARCHLHGGVQCSVPGCRRRPVRKIPAADPRGPAGVRCNVHSSPHAQVATPAAALAPAPVLATAAVRAAALPMAGIRLGSDAPGVSDTDVEML